MNLEKKAQEDIVNVGLNILYYRKKKNLTQEQLAEKADISLANVGRVETPNSDSNPTLNTIFKIAYALEIQPNKLFMFKED